MLCYSKYYVYEIFNINISDQDISSNTSNKYTLFIYYVTIHVSLTCFGVSNTIFRKNMCQKYGIILVEDILFFLKLNNRMKLCLHSV